LNTAVTLHAQLRADRLEFARRLFGLTTDTDLAAHMGKHRHTIDRNLNLNRGGRVSHDFVGALLAAFPGSTFEDFFETPDADEDINIDSSAA
jgi:hypothetical protein